MKRFMKVCAITALVLVVIGIALAITGGSIEGASRIREVVDSVTDGKIDINLANGENWGITLKNSNEVHYDISDELMFDKGYDIWEGDVEKFALGSSVSKLNIQAGGCEFRIEESEDDNFYAEAWSVGKFQCFVKDDTLYVRGSKAVLGLWDNKDCEILLYVPADYQFEQLDIEVGVGQLLIGNAAASVMNLEVGAGELIADYLQAEKCNMTVGAGELTVNDMQMAEVCAEVGMGHLQLAGELLGDMDAECAMGSIEMELAGREEDFNYAIECAMGDISINDRDYSGLAHEETIRNNADKTIEMECAMGSVNVYFVE